MREPIPKRRVLILSGSEGHRSLAAALQEVFEENGWETRIYEPRGVLISYRFFYKVVPFLYFVSFRLHETPWIRRWTQRRMEKRWAPEIDRQIKNFGPDLVCSTWLVYAHLLRRFPVPSVNVVADPYSFSGSAVSRGADVHVLFDEYSLDKAAALGLEKPAARSIGWLTRKAFASVASKAVARGTIGLRPDAFTVLIVSGSVGTFAVLKVLAAFLRPPVPAQVIFSVGHNAPLGRLARFMAAVLSKINRRDEFRVITVPFTDRLHSYMQAADIVVGKAGPNSLFESVATHAPFMAVTHMTGQETGNLELIARYRLGYVAGNPIKAVLLLRWLMRNPEELDVWREPLQRFAAWNRGAGERFMRVAEELFSK